MSTYLYRLGALSVRRRGTVLALWLILLATLGTLGGQFGKTAQASFSIPGIESVSANTLLSERFPAGASGAAGRIVFAAPTGAKLSQPALHSAIEKVVAEAKAAPQVASVTDPYATAAVSSDGTVAYASVQYTVPMEKIAASSREALLNSATVGRQAGLKVEFGGEAVQAIPGSSSTEGIGVLVALLVLAVTFGSVLAAGLPLLSALIGVGVGITGITATSAFVNLTSTAPTLALMMGLAVGIDYAPFIVSRHRQYLGEGLEPGEAAARAVATAGGAVVFAGLTVVIALSGLSVVGIPFLTTMGLAAAATVAVAVLIATTLVPALLGFAGHRLDRWSIPGTPAGRRTKAARRTGSLALAGAVPGTNIASKPNFGTRWARGIVARPVPVLVAAVVALGVIALPALSLRLGQPDDGNQPTTSTQRQAYDTLARGFGPGFNGPLTIVVDAAASPDPRAAAQKVSSTLATVKGVVEVSPATFNAAGDTAVISVIPATGPTEAGTATLVTAIRHHQGEILNKTGARLLVTGATAVNLDVSTKLFHAMPLFLLIIVGLSLVLLTIVFRSLLVPLKATLGFLLSIVSTFGALVAVFQWGWLKDLFGVNATGPVIALLPILLIALLFGLAMDYELFLVTRMREGYVHGANAKDAVVGGFATSARVVTAAAIIMTSVFSGFILGDDATIKSIGFALAFGVLVDAFVVRMTIVPAVMALLGDRAWSLPSWLERVVPRVDIEGESLARRLQGMSDGERLHSASSSLPESAGSTRS
ncbi:MAG: putative drug exporter of the superfamily [Frankiales bacterium]|nr:putative drug exporter of the superfamily [Frankiales bacterium]